MRLHRILAVVLSVLALSSIACTLALLEAPGQSPLLATPTAPAVVVNPNQPAADLPVVVPGGVSLSDEELLMSIYERVSPGIVNVSVLIDGVPGGGSGFVLDTNGYIMTNSHVVAEATNIVVTFPDGRVFDAEVTGTDNYGDLAVIKIEVPEGYTLHPLELGDSNGLRVGQRVIVIGNPFGLTSSMSVGIVSALGRTMDTLMVLESGRQFTNPAIIQTDAAINPGNSGGPMLDTSGRVIGVTEAIRSETGVNSGIGFAIPVNTVKLVAPQLIQNGRADYPYLGVSGIPGIPMPALAAEFDLPVTEGVLVQEVIEGEAAAEAGLRGGTQETTWRGVPILLGGDIITHINGIPIKGFNELIGYLVSNTRAGETVTFTINRDGETMDVDVTLGTRPNDE
jgi:S1-C subfamily serine protease